MATAPAREAARYIVRPFAFALANQHPCQGPCIASHGIYMWYRDHADAAHTRDPHNIQKTTRTATHLQNLPGNREPLSGPTKASRVVPMPKDCLHYEPMLVPVLSALIIFSLVQFPREQLEGLAVLVLCVWKTFCPILLRPA
jgi:hypothetical protein